MGPQKPRAGRVPVRGTALGLESVPFSRYYVECGCGVEQSGSSSGS